MTPPSDIHPVPPSLSEQAMTPLMRHVVACDTCWAAHGQLTELCNDGLDIVEQLLTVDLPRLLEGPDVRR